MNGKSKTILIVVIIIAILVIAIFTINKNSNKRTNSNNTSSNESETINSEGNTTSNESETINTEENTLNAETTEKGDNMNSEIAENELNFGKYYTNNNKDLEPIEWIQLDEKNGQKLLITKYAIDSVPFNNKKEAVSWDKSDIRKWLNDDFYNTAFSDEEKEKIALTKNTAEKNPNHPDNTVIGSNTEDNVFLLSYQEVSKYFPNENDRILKPTKYAEEKGCYTNGNGDVAWWTRSAGLTETSPEYLASSGDFGTREHQVDEKIIGTRPAIWVNE